MSCISSSASGFTISNSNIDTTHHHIDAKKGNITLSSSIVYSPSRACFVNKTHTTRKQRKNMTGITRNQGMKTNIIPIIIPIKNTIHRHIACLR